MADSARAWALAAAGQAPLAPGTTLTELTLGGRPAVRVRPTTGGHRATVLYLHGGGFRTGSPRVAQGVASYLAAELDAEVLLPAYRLSDEEPFPAAVEDAVAAYTELLGHGAHPQRLAVGGESAGGGLAVAALLGARAAGLPAQAAVVGLSPWYDLTVTSEAYERCRESDAVLSRESMRESAWRYLAGADPRTPLASPVFAEDAALAWLPPVLVQASAGEVLSGDAEWFVRRVNEAGGRASYRPWAPAVGHCWHIAVPGSSAARAALAEIAVFLRTHLDT